MKNSRAEHLSQEEFETLVLNSAQAKDDQVVAHLESCNQCREKAKAYEAAAMKVSRLNPVPRPSSGGCTKAEEWRAVASGAVSPERANEYLLHAAQCDTCGPLVRTTRAFDAEFTPEEELAISRLTMPAAERTQMAARLSSKSQAGAMESKPGLSLWTLFRMRPAFAYGLSAAVLVIVAGALLLLNSRTASPDKLLARAYAEQRTLEPRFAGAEYGPVRIVRGPGQSSVNKPQALLDAESMIHRHLQKEPNSTLWLDAKGRVDLLEANYDAALQTFQKALDLEPNSPRLLTDAASAYFERGQLAGRPDDYGQAIELLGRVLARNANDPVALFNRALIDEKMFLYHQALEDWNHYLRIDPTGDWAEEARRHRDAVQQKLDKKAQILETPLLRPAEFASENKARTPGFSDMVDLRTDDYVDQALRVWLPQEFEDGNATQDLSKNALHILGEILNSRHGDQWLLDFSASPHSKEQATAIQMLVTAAKANTDGDYLSAQKISLQAGSLFRQARNPAGALRARFEAVYALQRSNQDNQRCVAEANSAIAALPRQRYPWIETQLYLERFMCAGQLAHFEQAREDLDKAFAIAERSKYGALYLRALGMAASLHRGEGEASFFDHQGLARYWDGFYPPVRAFQFYSDIAFAAEDAGRWGLALAAAREAVDAISSADQPLTEGLARYQLARYALIGGDQALADSESGRANALLSHLPQNDVTRSYQVNQEVRLARLETQRGRMEQSRMHLKRAEERLPKARNYFTTLRFYNALSDLQLREGNRKEAEKALTSAVAIAELGLASLRDERERADWARETGESYRRLAWLHWQSQDVEGAWKIWEWYLGAPVRNASVPTVGANSSNFDAASLLPAMNQATQEFIRFSDATVISYLQLPEGFAVWVSSKQGLAARWINADPREIARLARRFREECARADSDPVMLRRDARALYDLLIAPVSDRLSQHLTLIIEPDGVVSEVPFTALMDVAGHYLSESYAVVFSPGMLYAEHLRRSQPLSRHVRALVVGPPPVTGSLAADLEPLKDADREAEAVASRFDTKTLLTGPDANLESVSRNLSQAAIFHFAGHALLVNGKPSLILAGVRPANESAVFDAERIQLENLHHLQLAVLSACSTGKTGPGGVEALARSFLRNGVPDVVASRWNVDSAATADFMRFFYDGLMDGEPVALSLNAARNRLRRQTATAHPYYWAAFDVFGR